MPRFRRATSLLTAAALLCSPLGACSHFPGGMSGGQLAVDAADPCGPQRAAFSRSGEFFAQDLAARVTTGAVIGAGVGALAGGLAKGGQGALIGGLIGLAGGLAGGLASAYWSRLSQSGLDQQTLSQTVNHDLRSEVDGIDHTLATFADVRACRFGQARSIKADAARGAIARTEAQTRLARQRAWFDEEVAAARTMGANMQKRDEQFAYAAEQMQQAPEAVVPSSPRSAQPRGRGASGASAVVVATQTLPQKRNGFTAAIDAATAQAQPVFSFDAAAGI